MPFNISPYAAVAMLVFIAVSVPIGAAMAGAGGWRALAERYPALNTAPLKEERYRFTSIRTGGGLLGTATYESCVMVGVSPQGLSLALWAPFRLLHPPLFLPWEALESCRSIECLWGKATLLTVRDGGNLTFTGRAAVAIADYAAQRGVSGGAA
jgi:hypothetical protein